MANKQVFDTKTAGVPRADTINEAGGNAYSFSPKHGLAQYAATGCLSDTYYTDAQAQLDKVLELARQCPEDFVARAAIYAHGIGMKDMPALLCAFLTKSPHFQAVFERVIDGGKMLRNFVQIIRSGQVGRRSFGSKPKRAIQQWFSRRSPKSIFMQSVGGEPSFKDILKMCHPKPLTRMENALYAYLLGKELSNEDGLNLPSVVKAYIAFVSGASPEVPPVPFQMLYPQLKTKEQWTALALQATWQTIRMNLNLFQRHGLMEDPLCVNYFREMLTSRDVIHMQKLFPYQILMTLKAIAPLRGEKKIPDSIVVALEQAMEIATENVPELPVKSIVVCPDVSGSMRSPITGYRRGSTSQVRCVDVAALIAACIVRKNPEAMVLPFEQRVVCHLVLNPRDTIATNADKLASVGGGGTSCSAPLEMLLRGGIAPDVIIYISDLESWADFCDGNQYRWSREKAGSALLWKEILRRNPNAKLVLIDLQANPTTQVPDSPSTLNIGGFSDKVFELISTWLKGATKDHWVEEIEKVDL